MDCTPVDQTTAWEVAAAAAAQAAATEINALTQQHTSIFEGATEADEEEDAEQRHKIEQRSILVRDLPRSLGTEEATEALRMLFSQVESRSGLVNDVPKKMHTQGSQVPPSPVPARQGALPQSSWRNNRRYANEGSRGVGVQANVFQCQRTQLMQQLPHAITSIRVATDQLGGSAYAIVDFSHEIHASIALQLLGNSAVLPGTLSQVRLSLHETWSSPLVVDQYHLYVAGLPPGATAAHVEALVRATTGVAPSLVKISSVGGIPSRRGIREYAFLRFFDDAIADDALKKLEDASASLHLIVRRVYEHRHRGNPAEPLTHAANCSIFIANLPPLTNSEELREICSYFHLVRAAEVHPTRNFGFVRMGSHESALAAITHLRGMQLRGRTLACAWSSRCLTLTEEETYDDAWERAEEAYAMMSAQCMDCEIEPPTLHISPLKQHAKPTLSPEAAVKLAVADVAGEAFWLSFLAEAGPVTISDICCELKQRQQQAKCLQSRLQLWHEQAWEEDT